MYKSKVLKLSLLFLVFIFVVSFSLFGCKKEVAPAEEAALAEEVEEAAPAEEEAAEEPVKLTMWYWGEQEGPGMEGWVNESIEMYQAEHPNITIEAVLQTTEGLYSAFRTAAEAKQTPDIQYMWSETWTFEDVWMGNVMDITEYWSEEDLKYMTNADTGVLEGKRYGVSFYFMPYTMVYNKKVLEASGIKSPPETWDEFIEDCKVLKENGFVPYSVGLKDNMFAAFICDFMVPQYFNKQSEAMLPTIGEAKWTDYTYADWWKKLAQLIPYFNEDAASIDVYQGVDAFGQGNVGFEMYAYGGIAPLYDVLGEDIVRMSFPRIGEGSYFTDRAPQSAQQLVVPAYSEHPKEACDFLKFILSPERANAMYVASGLFPCNNQFDKSLMRNEFEKSVFEYSVERPMHNAICNYTSPEVAWGGIGTYFTPIYNGELSSEEVAQTIEDMTVQWRESNPDMLENYKSWYNSLVEMEKSE